MDITNKPMADLAAWYRRAIIPLVAEAERGHGDQVQRRSWAAAAASAYAKPKDPPPTPVDSLGALRHLDPLTSSSPLPASPNLVSDFVALASNLPWTASPRTDPAADEVAMVDLFECLDMDLAGAGVMLLGPGAEYPEHQHNPAELYLVMHGSRRWRFGGSDRYLLVDQGQVLSNSSMDVHGVQGGDDTLLALWVLMDDRY